MYPHYHTDSPDKYEFLTDHGILYIIEFTNAACYSTSTNPICNRIEAINFGPVLYEKKIKDKQVSETIADIIRERCRLTNGAILFICESIDGKGECRSRLFNFWNSQFNSGEFHFQPAIVEYFDGTLRIGLVVEVSNVDADIFLSEFRIEANLLGGKN